MRTDDTVREPWMRSKKVIDRYGAMVPPNGYRCTSTLELSTTLKLLRSTSSRRRTKDEITISRSFTSSGIGARRRLRVPEWQALCQSWNQFVVNFNNGPAAYREGIASARERFMRYSITSVVQRVQEGSVNAYIPCAVPEGVHCSHCPAGAPRISERDLTGYTTNRVPANIIELRAKLACTRQHPSVVPEHNTLRNTAPRSVTPPVRGGIRSPSPFPERPSSGRFGETTYDSVGGAGRSSYGQPPVDHGLQALHARVEALATVQASESAEFRQQLNLQKTYVVEAAQTTSDIRVELLEQVRLLREK
ncbi:hypothetical protein PHMEG_00040990, partial [Phytophthora megakarya]